MKLYVRFVCVALLCLGLDQGFSQEIEKGAPSELNGNAPDSPAVLDESRLALNNTDLSENDGTQSQSKDQKSSTKHELGILGGGGFWDLQGPVSEVRGMTQNSIIYFPTEFLGIPGRFFRIRGWLGFFLGASEDKDASRPFLSLYAGGTFDLRKRDAGYGVKKYSNAELGIGGGVVSPGFIFSSWVAIPIPQEKKPIFHEAVWLNTRIRISPADVFYFALGIRIGVGIMRLDFAEVLGSDPLMKRNVKKVLHGMGGNTEIVIPLPLAGADFEIGFKMLSFLTAVVVVEAYTSNMDPLSKKHSSRADSISILDYLGLMVRSGLVFTF